MANATPFSGLSDAAGGILLPEAQGALLTKGVLQEAGALAFAGDARTTSSRHRPAPARSVSRTCEAHESRPSNTAAIPPWA